MFQEALEPEAPVLTAQAAMVTGVNRIGWPGAGSRQEEDLCRSALLYSCLLQAPDYYDAHRASTDL
ncbi:poly(ADP-ribose) glycohydrolase domain-containing protein, partial [Kitasatospora sp. NPDC001539]|uniref:poly(ADP-ribose) glycohydrolase domain-containing protein n=1 Tax=Kitasatospora sp. NPDC001539 TaxID=3154384 RepID=UPI003323CE8C